MNKIAAYEAALARLDAEKTAEAIIDAYGTSEGYMPGPYLLAFDQMEKEAGIKALQEFGKGLFRSGMKGAKTVGTRVGGTREGGKFVRGGWKMNKGMGAGDQLKWLGSRAQMHVGRALQTGGGQAALGAAGAAGVGAAGYGGYRVLGGGQK